MLIKLITVHGIETFFLLGLMMYVFVIANMGLES